MMRNSPVSFFRGMDSIAESSVPLCLCLRPSPHFPLSLFRVCSPSRCVTSPFERGAPTPPVLLPSSRLLASLFTLGKFLTLFSLLPCLSLEAEHHSTHTSNMEVYLIVALVALVVLGSVTAFFILPLFFSQRRRQKLALRLFLAVPKTAAIELYRMFRRRGRSGGSIMGGDSVGGEDGEQAAEDVARAGSAAETLISKAPWWKELPPRIALVVVVASLGLIGCLLVVELDQSVATSMGLELNKISRREAEAENMLSLLCEVCWSSSFHLCIFPPSVKRELLLPLLLACCCCFLLHSPKSLAGGLAGWVGSNNNAWMSSHWPTCPRGWATRASRTTRCTPLRRSSRPSPG